MVPSPASTVVLVRDAQTAQGVSQIETLLLLRNHQLVFAGGAWVFPGGKVDAGDYPAAAADAPQREYQAAVNAVVRETHEETGLSIPADDLIHIAHWTTPTGFPRRYATWFFLCPLQTSAAVEVDSQEILDHQWVTPEQALVMHARNELLLPKPTAYTLNSIASYSTLTQLCQAMRAEDIYVFPEGSEYYRPV